TATSLTRNRQSFVPSSTIGHAGMKTPVTHLLILPSATLSQLRPWEVFLIAAGSHLRRLIPCLKILSAVFLAEPLAYQQNCLTLLPSQNQFSTGESNTPIRFSNWNPYK